MRKGDLVAHKKIKIRTMGPSNYRSIPKSNNETKDLGSTSIKISGGIINVNKY